MEDAQLVEAAAAEGFSGAAVISTESIVFDPSFRPYCAENLCGQYGANYSCPPDCGSPEEMKQKILSHRKALVLEMICPVRDYRDTQAVKAGKKRHNQAGQRLMKKLRAQGCDGFMVGASGCSLCSPCRMTEGLPCTFPDLRWSCMSAYCIYVKKLAEDCALDYTPGEGKISFFGLYVFD